MFSFRKIFNIQCQVYSNFELIVFKWILQKNKKFQPRDAKFCDVAVFLPEAELSPMLKFLKSILIKNTLALKRSYTFSIRSMCQHFSAEWFKIVLLLLTQMIYNLFLHLFIFFLSNRPIVWKQTKANKFSERMKFHFRSILFLQFFCLKLHFPSKEKCRKTHN